MENGKSTIKKSTWWLMLGTALLFDIVGLLGIIPFVGILVDIVTGLTFWFWFHLHGVKFNSTKRISAGLIGLVFKAIPILNLLPDITASVFFTLLTTRLPKVAQKATSGVIGKLGPIEASSSFKKVA